MCCVVCVCIMYVCVYHLIIENYEVCIIEYGYLWFMSVVEGS